MNQAYVRDGSMTVADLINQQVIKLGEKFSSGGLSAGSSALSPALRKRKKKSKITKPAEKVGFIF